MAKRRRSSFVGYVARDRNVNVIVRSQLITAYAMLLFYILLVQSSIYVSLPKFFLDIKEVLGALIIAWVLWHTINYFVSKNVIKSNS